MKIRFEWREGTGLMSLGSNTKSKEVEWDSVPRVGDSVEINSDGETREVIWVCWSLHDGEVVVRLR